MNSNNKQPVIIGVDGGGTKVQQELLKNTKIYSALINLLQIDTTLKTLISILVFHPLL